MAYGHYRDDKTQPRAFMWSLRASWVGGCQCAALRLPGNRQYRAIGAKKGRTRQNAHKRATRRDARGTMKDTTATTKRNHGRLCGLYGRPGWAGAIFPRMAWVLRAIFTLPGTRKEASC